MRKILLFLLLVPRITYSQIEVSHKIQPGESCFAIAGIKKATDIYFDTADFELVKKVGSFFMQDVERVTGKRGNLTHERSQFRENVIIIGTIGHCSPIDALISSKRLDVAPIVNQWERFMIKTIDKPFPGVKKALIVAGSDRRGTAYGVFSISEAIGVSPWYWWADVPVQKSHELYIKSGSLISKAPSVRYRGIFLNDEDWGLKPWASKLMDPALNDIGPNTYARVFELMLRLKANYLWPAMHACSGAFNKYEENRLVADSFGIIMGSSHCEPLLFNNASEWDRKTMGEWNYITNKTGILEQLEKRVRSNASYENVYTLGLRGLHDAGMIGNLTQQEQVINLQNAINDQRDLLKKYIDAPIESIPQVLIPYKEVMKLYEKGLQVPDEVTLVWPDDNYGYIKRLSTPEEQKRTGGSGVYYHLSYLGEPHNYLWMNTTSPALLYEEMAKAYHAGADRVWIMNAGDIKGCEYAIDLAMNMAWDIDAFNYQTIIKHPAAWSSAMFGAQYYNDFQEIWDHFYHLAFIRKPEYMGWGYEWNSRQANTEKITDTDFSFTHYREVEKRLEAYRNIALKANTIMAWLKEEQQAAYFQLVYYPVKAAQLMNEKMLTAQQNRFYAKQGRAKTNTLACTSKMYMDSLQMLTDEYNSMRNGKWSGMMSLKQGYLASSHLMPPVDSISLPDEPVLGIFAEGDKVDNYSPKPFASLPCFNSFAPKTYYVDVVNKGGKILDWEAVPSEEWIVISRKSGKTEDEQRIEVSIDWQKLKLPADEYTFGEITFISGIMKEKVLVSAFQPQYVKKEELKGLFVEQNGYISIPAADFHRKNEDTTATLIVIDGLGIENKAIQFGEPMNRIRDPQASIHVNAEYDFYTFSSGNIKIFIYALPVFPLNPLEDARYALTIDNGLIFKHDITTTEYADGWKQNVLRNCAINQSVVSLPSPGRHTLKISGITQGMVIQKIVMDLGGLKDSYTGPESTKVE